MKKIKVAIMGLGTVGGGTYDALTRNRDSIRSGYGVDVEVKKILSLFRSYNRRDSIR